MRSILKASAVMGLSSVIAIVLSIVRQKFIAVTLGPEGIGLLGLLVTGLGVATTFFSLGLANSGIRYIAGARAEEDIKRLLYTRSSLMYGSQVLGFLGGALFVIFRIPLANLILGDPSKSLWIVWLGIALWASVVSGAQLAVVNGLRRIGSLAKANIWGSALGTIATLVAISISGEIGLVAAIVATPLTTWLAAWWLSRDISLLPLRDNFAALWASLGGMVGLGLAFAAGLIFATISRFLVRLLLNHTLGLASTGYFQAAWGIATVYLGFLSSALAAEYYPRLSAIVSRKDNDALNEAVSKQIHIVLLLAAPIILGLILFTPLAVHLLYSKDFQATIPVLRWQLVGDVLKITSWAISFLLLAYEARVKFFIAELSWNGLYLLSLVVFLPHYGLIVTGVAYAACYLAYLGINLWFAYTESKFKLAPSERNLLVCFLLASLLIRVLVEFGAAGTWISSMLLVAAIVYAVWQLQQLTHFSFKSIVNFERFKP